MAIKCPKCGSTNMVLIARTELELPKCVELPKWLWPEDGDDIEGYPPFYDDEISDWLSNEYGYCVESFTAR